MSNEIDVVEAFIAAINRRSPAEIAELMTEDHTFVDSRGRVESGREHMTAGWDGYFRLFPDYRIVAESLLADGRSLPCSGPPPERTAAGGGRLPKTGSRCRLRESRGREWQGEPLAGLCGLDGRRAHHRSRPGGGRRTCWSGRIEAPPPNRTAWPVGNPDASCASRQGVRLTESLRQAVLAFALGGILASSTGASQAQGGSRVAPPVPFEDVGACPFEGCVYREWTAEARGCHSDGSTADRTRCVPAESGRESAALTGVVVTLKAGRVQFREPRTLRTSSGAVTIVPGRHSTS